MKILAETTVVRLHVEFDEAETTLLKHIRFLPPHAAARAQLWVTESELQDVRSLIDKAKAANAAVIAGLSGKRGP